MEHLNDLYRPEDLSRLEKKIKRERAWIWILAGATLALCVLFCCLTDSRNAGRMELAAEICSCLGGWLVIYRRIFGLQEAKHQRDHVQHLLEAPRTSLRGRLTITKERMRIKNSIRFRVLLLDDGEQLRRLKVNETRVRLLQPFDGKEVTLELADGYVAGIEGEEAFGAPAKGGRGRSLADFLKNIWSQLHRFVVWAILSTILWAWIFTLVTDTGPANKVTLYVQTEGCRDQALAEVLDEARPEGIRMIQVHPFSYALFDTQEALNADLYVIPASQAEGFLDSFAPIDGEELDRGDRELFTRDGKSYGIKLHDAATGESTAGDYLVYAPGEDYYLFFNVNSLHLGGGDGAALRVAEALLRLK